VKLLGVFDTTRSRGRATAKQVRDAILASGIGDHVSDVDVSIVSAAEAKVVLYVDGASNVKAGKMNLAGIQAELINGNVAAEIAVSLAVGVAFNPDSIVVGRTSTLPVSPPPTLPPTLPNLDGAALLSDKTETDTVLVTAVSVSAGIFAILLLLLCSALVVVVRRVRKEKKQRAEEEARKRMAAASKSRQVGLQSTRGQQAWSQETQPARRSSPFLQPGATTTPPVIAVVDCTASSPFSYRRSSEQLQVQSHRPSTDQGQPGLISSSV